MLKKFFFAGFVFCAHFLVFFEISFAQEQYGLTIDPYFQDVVLHNDSQDASISVNVTNNTKYPSVFKLSVVDFGSLDETGGVAFAGSSANLDSKYNLASWMILEKDAFVLAAGETQPIRATIKNRESLSPGGHYAAIMLNVDEGDNLLNTDPTKVSVNPAISSLIFIRKVGGEVYNLSLKEKILNSNFFGLPDLIKLRFQNSGNVHVNPRGVVLIKDPMGREVFKGIINQESSLVLPGTFRLYPITLKKLAITFVPGKYKVLVDYRFDGKDDFSSEDMNIFIIPTEFIYICVFLLVMIGGGIYLFRNKKSFSKKKI